MELGTAKLVNYADELPVEAKQRYRSKLDLASGIDPILITAKDGYMPTTPPPMNHRDTIILIAIVE